MGRKAGKLGAALLAVIAMGVAQDAAIDVERSTITIHVGKAGLLSAAGHEHWVNAPLSSGTIRESPSPSIEFTVETAKMMVKPDPKVDAKTQAQIQKDMEEMTLQTQRFPQITFHSSRIEKLGDTQWKVEGELSLHGVTKPVSLTVNERAIPTSHAPSSSRPILGSRPSAWQAERSRLRTRWSSIFRISPDRNNGVVNVMRLIVLGALLSSAFASDIPPPAPDLYRGWLNMYDLRFDDAHQVFRG